MTAPINEPELKLTPNMLKVMFALKKCHDRSGSQLMDLTGLMSDTVHPILFKLEREDLVESRILGKGRRVYRLTDAGTNIVDQTPIQPSLPESRWWKFWVRRQLSPGLR